MSLDAAFQKALRPIEERIEQLERRVEVAERDLKRPTYDAKQLREELGYSQHEAYAILRAHGVMLNGRRRISATDLIRIHSQPTHLST